LPDTISINLKQLREPPDPRHSYETLAKFAARSRAGSISIHLNAVESGCSTVSLSIWNEKVNRPVDNIGIRLAVATANGSPPACYSRNQKDLFYGQLASLFDEEVGHRVDAGLNIFDIDNEDFAVFKSTEAAKDAPLVWKLRQPVLDRIDNPAALPQTVELANNNQAYAALYLEFTRDIFASGDEEGDANARVALDQLRAIANTKEHPSLFGRLVDSKGRPFILPLGLIALDDQGKRPLGSKYRVLQPLPANGGKVNTGCVDTWQLVLPQSITDPTSDESTVNAPISKTSSSSPRPSSDRIRDITNWPEFDSYLDPVLSNSSLPTAASADVSETPEGLLLLAHQYSEIISFLPGGVPPHAQASDLRRTYAPGSIAILLICGTGLFDYGHGNVDTSWIYRLNRQGVSTIIVSPFSIPQDQGVALAERLESAIDRLDPSKGSTSLAELWASTFQLGVEADDADLQMGTTSLTERWAWSFEDKVAATGAEADDTDLQIVSEFVIAGESDVRFCGR